ncbi:glycoside hydrolase family 9 protein [Vibrio sp.]|uniref:glycoside hydrolase family 9 protein n=1 Tax=Vibrio sp. TaxID=678 RepID=UPI003D0F6980
MQILINHIGYELAGPKQAVLVTQRAYLPHTHAELVSATDHQPVARLAIEAHGRVDQWHQGEFYRIDFSSLSQPGQYYLQFGDTRSACFTVAERLLLQKTLSDLLHYFKSQRCSGEFDRQDRCVPLFEQSQRVDVHGGWYDASGDVSKYLSHLSYANFLNPQQIPMVVWNMLYGLEQSAHLLAPFTQQRLQEEALYGVEFLLRMQHPSGYFYTTVFDGWSKQLDQRQICSYATQQGKRSADFQAGFRQGGGIAIAALAKAAGCQQLNHDTAERYFQAAVLGYHHLLEHNHRYLDDGQPNIIDEYCALLAAVALYQTSQDLHWLIQSRDWAERLIARQRSDDNFAHYWSANDSGSRPYYHAAEAGLPGLALCQYLAIETEPAKRQRAITALRQSCQFELQVTSRDVNPFGYPRQYVKPVDGPKQDSFFIPHHNESGYWWQGENARLASLACMAYSAQPYLTDQQQTDMAGYAQNCLNWIVGLNPFDICMLDGHGRNNPDYLPELGFFNAKGGICNGITAGFDNQRDIAFNPEPHSDDMLQNWRWGEQWIPHGGWYLLAILLQGQHASHNPSEERR